MPAYVESTLSAKCSRERCESPTYALKSSRGERREEDTVAKLKGAEAHTYVLTTQYAIRKIPY